MAAAPVEPPPLSRIDRLIGWLSPGRALRRERARVALAAVRAYEGAARSRRTEGWRVAAGTGPNVELIPSLQILRDRARDHVRNNPYGRRAVRHLASSLVGYGITGTIEGGDARLADAWNAWVASPTCDQRGKLNFGGLQRLVARTFCESGEVLARRVWDEKAPLGFRVQVLEADHLDAASTLYPSAPATYQQPGSAIVPIASEGGVVVAGVAEGGRVIAGVEVDRDDRVVAYWLLPHHPGETWAGLLQTPVRVEAADIAHVYDEERAGMVRGAPMLAPVMIALRDLDELKDAYQMRQKIAACFTAFYSQPEGGTRSRQDPLCDHVEPGLVEELPPGYEVTFANPPGVDGYADVVRLGLQAIAAGMSVPYEEISGDFSQFNFSSGRMSRGAFYATIEELQWQVIIPKFLDRVFGWFLDAARLKDWDVTDAKIEWTTPRRPLVDPAREIPAAITAVRSTLSSPQEAIRELGYDPEVILNEWKEFIAWLDERRLVSDIDPRRVARTGNPMPEWIGPGESVDDPNAPAASTTNGTGAKSVPVPVAN